MSKIDKALHEICALDKEASSNGVLNKLNTELKLIVTIVYLVLVMWVKNYNIQLLILMGLYPVIVFTMFSVSFRNCLTRMKYVFGFIFVMAFSNFIFSEDKTVGFILMVGLLLKGILSILAVYILIATTRIESICISFRKMHVPEIIVTTILLIYRYINVLLKEYKKMVDSYKMMATAGSGVSLKYAGAFAGNLILRSIDKSKRVYESMNMRGYEWYVEKKDWE